MKRDIHKTVAYYVRKFETSDPFQIAKALHIELAIGDIGSRLGCYMYMKRHKCIFLNENLDEHEMQLCYGARIRTCHPTSAPKLHISSEIRLFYLQIELKSKPIPLP